MEKSEVSVDYPGGRDTTVSETAFNGEPKDLDEADMIRMGKAQLTRRNFGLIPLLGLTTIMLCSWEATFPFFLNGFINGGGPTLLYGFIFSWIGSLATCASISEMASMYPTSGGQYHWVALLAPPKYSVFLSWLTGWLSMLGWQAASATGAFLGGTIIQGLLVLNNPSYGYKRWHGTLLLYAVLLLSLLLNTVTARALPAIQTLLLILHIAGFFAVVIPLVHLAPMSTAQFVFAEYYNVAGYSDGLSWFVGITTSSVLFIGYDGAAHMAEEVRNASMNVPRSMFFTIFLNGALGFAAFVALLFSIGDVETALSSPTGYPFIQIFYGATKSKAAATVMTSVIVVLAICATIGYVASSSRQLWAFARDRGVPFSSTFAKIDKRLGVPLWAIAATAVINALLALINIGSTAAFSAIVSLIVSGLFSSYLISIGLMMRKRLAREPIPFGPWQLGRWGLFVNIVAFIYTLIAFVFSFFPPATPVKPISMNWSVVVYGFVVLSGLGYYAVYGRKQYKGPVMDRHD